ncbi:putative CUE domain protein (found in proteins involved in binding ubiquitin- conjugating enzymes and those in the IL1 signal transduction pathway) [Scheffersomyces stipitis CBS 6054]|uniref:Potential CUE domain protein (Found in proteins involved in binding ubiquitin-conjugating enzymes and those in the IL1 signal transduction pathway) n=1 Tax=Scheffersomyces stipitis (strain ATCC 58785 / CBS 6054 / NBRC 10063 / NRRL Y-11545) TaxID=322104 RepID=A3GFZ4_PICST|nr:potential CUE domain protein (found in proteins involved in binding ubiquitin- conjugating enzymes and those in the IL1 signal transduction pathway) [Scheffersomyces stipitis CBS 6054]EAZ63843.2 putative CUE domain protein (found in proteins involved in binding ubiquitin- conjugating enzymes and those in the IL1 signal transduction pathway) [Scheffersomyces stipitis CBS 6054]
MSKYTKELKVVANEPVDLDESGNSATKAAKEELEESTEIPLDDPIAAKTDESGKPDTTETATEAIPIDDAEEDAGPPPPPRPVDPLVKITNELKDAFPAIEEKIVTAVLIASQGNVDPAFNALLYLSDPSFKPEIPIPAEPVIAGSASIAAKPASATITDDELLARRLQKEFEKEEKERRRRHSERKQRKEYRDPKEFDNSPDEFDQIKDTFSQGFEEAKTTLNSWVSGLAKKFDGGNDQQSHEKQNPKLFGALGGSSFGENRGKAGSRFDEDPEIISHDFHNRISLNDNDTEEQPALPKRTSVDKQLPPEPQSDTPTAVPARTPAKKWQPLESDVPANSDAFLVTDSEDEDGADVGTGAKKTSAL